MKERGIMFTGDMVNAILDGRKTQTRRVIKPQPNQHGCLASDSEFITAAYGKDGHSGEGAYFAHSDYPEDGSDFIKCPFGKIGSKLYVKETFCSSALKWKSPLFMPKSASRITLEITGIKVEKLQNITEEDCIAEGIEKVGFYELINDNEFIMPGVRMKHYARKFMHLWEKIKGKDSWNQNPFVFVISFKVLKNDK